MTPIEIEGRTVAEAIDAALKQSGLRREQVEVTVISEGAAGFLGMGAKPARVRIAEKRWGEGAPPPMPASTPKPAAPKAAPYPKPAPKPAARVEPKPAPKAAPRAEPKPTPAPRPAPAAPRAEPRAKPERRERESAPAYRALTAAEAAAACTKAQELVGELLKMMSVAAPTLNATWDADMERVKLVVESQDASNLVGRDGRVLESLQFLTTLMMSRGAETPVAVQVDALSYWEKRETAILDAARKGIAAVVADGRPYRLEPMDAAMRRLIHRTFSSNPDIVTGSEGEGPWRKVVIRPRKG